MRRRTRAELELCIANLNIQVDTLMQREVQFQQVIDDIQKMKDEVTKERETVERERKQLEDEKEPINWLPEELLRQIFLTLADFEHNDTDQWHVAPVTVSHVSTKWRTIALSTSRLWKKVLLRGFKTGNAAKVFIERSRKTLLDVDYCTMEDTKPTEECHEVVNMVSVLSQHFDRIENLSVQCQAVVATTFIFRAMQKHPKTLPHLKHLSFGITTKDPCFLEVPRLLNGCCSDAWEKQALASTPNPISNSLLHLKVERIPLYNFPPTFITNLRSLEIAYSRRTGPTRNRYFFRMSVLCRFLKETPLLEELIINNTIPFFDVCPTKEEGTVADADTITDPNVPYLKEIKTIQLNHLKVIDWTFPSILDIHRFLSLFNLPVLEKLDLWVQDKVFARDGFQPHRSYIQSLNHYTRDTIAYPCLKDISLQCDGSEESSVCLLRKYWLPALEKVAFTNFDAAARKSGEELPPLPIFPRLESIFRDPRLPFLTHLTLSHFKLCPEGSRVDTMLGYTPFLTSLSFDSCIGVGRLIETLYERLFGLNRSYAGHEGSHDIKDMFGNVGNGVKVCPRLEALSFWGCQDLEFPALREVVLSRNINRSDFSKENKQKGVVGPNGATSPVTRGWQNGNPDASHKTETSQMGRKIRPLKPLPRHALELGSTSGPVAPTPNMVSSIISMQEAFRPAHIIYLRLANCKLITEEAALSLRDLGVVDVIWADSD